MPICYLVLLLDDDYTIDKAVGTKWRFRLYPVQIKTDDDQNDIPMYVATYALREKHSEMV
ncbi:hypothetical protein PI125_g14442 [Phytophthora idaei]|nr:hypothetical protein PI125_g14442 [Phytophthora idaei]